MNLNPGPGPYPGETRHGSWRGSELCRQHPARGVGTQGCVRKPQSPVNTNPNTRVPWLLSH